MNIWEIDTKCVYVNRVAQSQATFREEQLYNGVCEKYGVESKLPKATAPEKKDRWTWGVQQESIGADQTGEVKK